MESGVEKRGERKVASTVTVKTGARLHLRTREASQVSSTLQHVLSQVLIPATRRSVMALGAMRLIRLGLITTGARTGARPRLLLLL